MIASVSGIFSLFPLLFTPAGKPSLWLRGKSLVLIRFAFLETLVKIVYSVIWGLFVLSPLNRRTYEYVPYLPCQVHI